MLSEVKNFLQGLIKEAIQKAIDSGELSVESVPEILLERPKEEAHGDIACPLALVLAHQAKMPPRKIAQIIVDGIEVADNCWIEKVEVAGPGFINFFLTNFPLYELLQKIRVQGENFGRSEQKKKKRIQVEFVSANPTGPLNVVSGRAAAVGDAIVNLLNAAGHDAIREYYINDAGTQIDRLAKSVEARYRQLLGEKGLEIPEGGYKGEYLIDLARTLIDEKGDYYLKLNSSERLAKFKQIAVSRIVDWQKSTLKRFGVHFDVWTSEKEIRDSGKPDNIMRVFSEREYIYKKDGAIWFNLTDFGSEKDCVVVKSNGEWTYILPDTAYHHDKYERGFDKVIDLLGPDHQGHMENLKLVMKAMGFSVEQLQFLIVQQVNLIDASGNRVEMSKRKGKFYTLDLLIDELADTVEEQFAVDVARYFFLMRNTSAHLDFDLSLAVKQAEENPVFYVQYAHARICSIFNQMEKRGIEQLPIDQVKFELMDSPEEIQLMKKLAEFPELVINSAEPLEPHHIPHYLQDTASLFHTFYNKHRVLDNAKPELTQARLVLVDCVRTVLRNGLSLLGITAPESM